MRPSVRDWFDRRTTSSRDWPLAQLLSAKGDRMVDVILPALNEQDTVGRIVRDIRAALVDVPTPLVDDLVVVDSGSVDATAEVASNAGARVVRREDVFATLPVENGKGEAMWRGLAATSGDLVVFLDADLASFTFDYVTGLLGPLLLDDSVHLVKSVYDRPFVSQGTKIAAGGGRVTEIMARPLLNSLWPDLAGVAQPLAGECAARRSLLEQLPFPCGYGVEIALLVDTLNQVGLDGIAQVDLGERVHRHQNETGLSRMSAEILAAALNRADPSGAVHQPSEETTLPAFFYDAGEFGVHVAKVQTRERPPLAEMDRSGDSSWAAALAEA